MRIRDKMARWKLDIPPGILARKTLTRFKMLQKLVPPRVVVVYFKALWNAWPTEARFQREAPCVLCCEAQSRDRIEHYCFCPSFRCLVVNLA